MTSYELLESHIRRDYAELFGVHDEVEVASVARRWHDETRNYDGRWSVIAERRGLPAGRVLDMAAGCGTFVLHGLRSGHDVWGVEPEPWKHEYFRRKLEEGQYPSSHAARIVEGIGEQLPFEDGSFDVVTTFQTLEHVADVSRCVHEMLRVLRPGGALYLRAPDYASFYEPHYRLPFLPRMNRSLAALYLRALGRPTAGLDTLNWITRRTVVRALATSGVDVRVDDTAGEPRARRRERLEAALPSMRSLPRVSGVVLAGLGARARLLELRHLGRRERNIDLWIERAP